MKLYKFIEYKFIDHSSFPPLDTIVQASLGEERFRGLLSEHCGMSQIYRPLADQSRLSNPFTSL
jgi:hypothetical protein